MKKSKAMHGKLRGSPGKPKTSGCAWWYQWVGCRKVGCLKWNRMSKGLIIVGEQGKNGPWLFRVYRDYTVGIVVNH